MFHYQHCGLNNIFLNNGYKIHDYGNSRGLSIEDVDGLFDTIGQYIATKDGRLAANECKYLRLMMDQSPEEVAGLLGINKALYLAKEAMNYPFTLDEENKLRDAYQESLFLRKITPFNIKKRIKTDDFDEILLTLEHEKSNNAWRLRA